MQFDGTPLSFDACTGDGFSTDGSGCKWDEFVAYMDDIWYSGKDADNLDEACGLDFDP